MPLRIFISYSSVDRSEALEVRRLLINHGCTVWLDVFDIRVGAELKSELGQGIGNADVLCLLLSPTAVASPWVAEEIEHSEEQAASRGMRMVTVLLRPCRPPDRLRGRVMIDATAGISAQDVRARLARAVLGAEAVGDMEIDSAMQEALQAAQNEMETALVLPELAAQLETVRNMPIRKLEISFRHGALPYGRVLAVSFTFDELFSQPMWFLFAHYREGRTWPRWMKTLQERDHHEIRGDGKRIDGRFEWFDYVRVLDPIFDGTDLRDLPATFNLELSGEAWRPGGSTAAYQSGPTVPHLEQKMEVPSLAELLQKRASFAVALLGPEEESQQAVVIEENDFDIRIVAMVGDRSITLFRSAHGPVERAALRGTFLQNRKSAIEREAILGLFARPRDLDAAARTRRREAAFALLNKLEDELTPDERRVVGVLRYGQAQLAMCRVFGSAPQPGLAREELHRSALGECKAVCRILGPIAEQDPRIDDVGIVFWAATSLANYYVEGRAANRAVPYAEAAVGFVEEAARKDPNEAEYQRWRASGLALLAEAQAAAGDHAHAAANLTAAIDVLQALHETLPSTSRRRDLREAVESALKWSERWLTVSATERQRWAEFLSALS
jgi:hypothetical protein